MRFKLIIHLNFALCTVYRSILPKYNVLIGNENGFVVKSQKVSKFGNINKNIYFSWVKKGPKIQLFGRF